MWTILFSLFIDRFIYYKYSKHINKHMFFIIFLINIYYLYSKDMFFFIIFNVLLFESITDIINHDVFSICNLIIFAICFYQSYPNISYTSFLVPLTLYILNLFFNGMGIGDIELLFSICPLFDFRKMTLLIFLASIFNIIYSFFVRKESYSFIPFLSIGILLIYCF